MASHVVDGGKGNHDTHGNSIDGDILKGDIIIGTIAGEEVRQAAELEHELGFLDALRLYVHLWGISSAVQWRSVLTLRPSYPTAAGWSLFFSLGRP